MTSITARRPRLIGGFASWWIVIAKPALGKIRDGLSAPGFFDRARRPGRFEGDGNGPRAWSNAP
jgi:hypothetical protein